MFADVRVGCRQNCRQRGHRNLGGEQRATTSPQRLARRPQPVFGAQRPDDGAVDVVLARLHPLSYPNRRYDRLS